MGYLPFLEDLDCDLEGMGMGIGIVAALFGAIQLSLHPLITPLVFQRFNQCR